MTDDRHRPVHTWGLTAARLAAVVALVPAALVLAVALPVGLVLGHRPAEVVRAGTRWLVGLVGRLLQAPLPRRHRPGLREALWLVVHVLAGAGIFVVGALLWWAADTFVWDVAFPFGIFALPVIGVLAITWVAVPYLLRGFAALAKAVLIARSEAVLARRVEQLTESRAATVDAQAAELRRIERDLHDGAQARLAAVRMTLGLASQTLHSDLVRTAALLAEARDDAGRALAELRDLVRGIHPPVLADRGLAGGLEAASLLCPVPVDVEVRLAGRPLAPVESALYFAAAEALANIGRHAGATRAWLQVDHGDGVLRVVVGDDGRGGADPRRGSGLRGIGHRLAAFDGTLHVASPPGGPTELTMEVPCQLNFGSSSQKTTSCSATG